MRNMWDEPLGQMEDNTFERIVDSVKTLPTPPDIMFGCLGEPLMHPDIIKMIRQMKKLGSRVELITNGTLLSDALSLQLVSAGLDKLWVSIDGAKPKSYSDVRLGATLNDVIENVKHLRDLRYIHPVRIGIVFVAMKQNISDLPDVMTLGKKIGAEHFLITNIIPYTEEMVDNVLFSGTSWSDSVKDPSPLSPLIQATRIPLNELTAQPLYRVLRSWRISNTAGDTSGNHNTCPFIESGSIAISWNGNISPCIPLMRDHTSYRDDRRRISKKHIIGNIQKNTLKELWEQDNHLSLRERLQKFDFPPCTNCGGCKLSQTNEEDCFGNEFPTCGGCVWAQGLVRCP
jgi:radical SAM protein with 4Fe4S-binding SPASM domain